MTTEQKNELKRNIEAAYRQNLYQYAYYLELCLKTEQYPR